MKSSDFIDFSRIFDDNMLGERQRKKISERGEVNNRGGFFKYDAALEEKWLAAIKASQKNIWIKINNYHVDLGEMNPLDLVWLVMDNQLTDLFAEIQSDGTLRYPSQERLSLINKLENDFYYDKVKAEALVGSLENISTAIFVESLIETKKLCDEIINSQAFIDYFAKLLCASSGEENKEISFADAQEEIYAKQGDMRHSIISQLLVCPGKEYSKTKRAIGCILLSVRNEVVNKICESVKQSKGLEDILAREKLSYFAAEGGFPIVREKKLTDKVKGFFSSLGNALFRGLRHVRQFFNKLFTPKPRTQPVAHVERHVLGASSNLLIGSSLERKAEKSAKAVAAVAAVSEIKTLDKENNKVIARVRRFSDVSNNNVTTAQYSNNAHVSVRFFNQNGTQNNNNQNLTNNIPRFGSF